MEDLAGEGGEFVDVAEGWFGSWCGDVRRPRFVNQRLTWGIRIFLMGS